MCNIRFFVSVVKYIKEGKPDEALATISYLMLGGYNTLFYRVTWWPNVYNFISEEDHNNYLGLFLGRAETRKAIHVGDTTFGDYHVRVHLSRDMMVSNSIILITCVVYIGRC